MPTYEYECGSCGRRFEQFQPMSAPPAKKCPECGKGVRRLLTTGAAVIAHGSRGGASSAPPCAGRCPHADAAGRTPCQQ